MRSQVIALLSSALLLLAHSGCATCWDVPPPGSQFVESVGYSHGHNSSIGTAEAGDTLPAETPSAGQAVTLPEAMPFLTR